MKGSLPFILVVDDLKLPLGSGAVLENVLCRMGHLFATVWKIRPLPSMLHLHVLAMLCVHARLCLLIVVN